MQFPVRGFLTCWDRVNFNKFQIAGNIFLPMVAFAVERCQIKSLLIRLHQRKKADKT
jgi:hypothetical protein